MLLIVGGSQDHNIHRLVNAAEWRGIPHRVIFTDADPAPAVTWRPDSPDIEINGEKFLPQETSLFIRFDVFGVGDAGQRSAFYDAIKGWAAAHPQVGMFNRGNENLEMNKPRQLVLAAACGFQVPQTVITTDFNRFAEPQNYIVKPVGGGAYTAVLSDALCENPPQHPQDRPWIVQEKLNYPELRLFRVGPHYFAFEINSPAIDYRNSGDFTLRSVPPPPALVAALQKLTDRLGLDYAAADFKTHPVTGELMFLEVNTMPMFTGYDDAARGRLSDAMVMRLDEKPAPMSAPRRAPGL